MLNNVNKKIFSYVLWHIFEKIINFALEFFMVLDFKVNGRLVVGMTINFFMSLPLPDNYSISPEWAR